MARYWPEADRKRPRLVKAGLLVILLTVLAGCAAPDDSPSPSPSPSSGDLAAIADDGPKAPVDREIVPPEVRTRNGVTRVRFDLGNVAIGDPPQPEEFMSPLRGTLTLPARSSSTRARLIVIGHLRAATCADASFRFPCGGADSIRYDAGMDYLAEKLAAQGYAVLAPDLAPVFVGQLARRGSYDQTRAWRRVVLDQVESLSRAADQSEARKRLVGSDSEADARVRAVDTSSILWIAHSRSGMMIRAAAEEAAKAGITTRGALYLATAHDVGNNEGESLDDPPLDVPSLGIVGGRDRDVPSDSVQWAAAHFGVDRRSPLAVATVGSFGHTQFNAAPELADDRPDCGSKPASPSCPSGEEARAMMITTAVGWAKAVDDASFPSFMTDAATAVPSEWLGYRADWFVHTLAPRRVLVDAAQEPAARALKTEDASVQRCRIVDLMEPVAPGATSCPDDSDVAARPGGPYLLADWKPGGTLSVSTGQPSTAARTVVLHLMPFRKSDPAGVQLDIRVASSRVALGSDTPGLRIPGVGDDGAKTTTVRVPLPPGTAGASVTLGSDTSAGGVLITGMELVTSPPGTG